MGTLFQDIGKTDAYKDSITIQVPYHNTRFLSQCKAPITTIMSFLGVRVRKMQLPRGVGDVARCVSHVGNDVKGVHRCR